jgi:protease-4
MEDTHHNPVRASKQEVLMNITYAITFVALTLFSLAIYDLYFRDDLSEVVQSEVSDCSVMGVRLHGFVTTYVQPDGGGGQYDVNDVTSSDSVSDAVRSANADPDIQAILVDVDSSGGYAVAGEEIAYALKHSEKPVVGVIRGQGVSAAYWGISGASHIFASKNSDVGSIGVTLSYLDNVGKNAKEGVSYIQLSAGKYKDMGNPDRALTADEKNLLMRDIEIVHKNFIDGIAENRKIPREAVVAIADGSSVLGERARALNLIDDIGGVPDAEAYIEKLIGEKVSVCWQ